MDDTDRLPALTPGSIAYSSLIVSKVLNLSVMVWIWNNFPRPLAFKAWSPTQQTSEVGFLGNDRITRALSSSLD